MSITATVDEGKIVLPAGVHWPSGTVVRIEPVETAHFANEAKVPTLWEMLKDFDGMAGDLPSDLAANLNHYVHGHSRA
jgi:hypothetical protein